MTPIKALRARFGSRSSAVTAEPPPHSGLRPLSPYGEGYCGACQFVVGLGPDGRLEEHGRMANIWSGSRDRCKGSGRKAPVRIPETSRKAAFRTRVRTAHCGQCQNQAEVLNTPDGTSVLAVHRIPWATVFERCPGSGQAVG